MDKYDSNHKNYLLKSLKDIDLSKQISFKTSTATINQIILKTNNLTRRVDEKCEIFLYIQRYFSNKTDQSLTLINKDYMNILKKNPSTMKNDELLLRECLLKVFDQQKVLFIIPKKNCLGQYGKDIKLLKISKEEEEKYEDCIYYKIEIESILYNYPNEPPLTQHLNYINYIKKFQEEIRYLLTKKHYTHAEKWANTVISKVLGMSNASKSNLSDKVKKEFLKLMKPIILNKTLSLTLKDGDEKSKREGYEKSVKCIENEYYKNYANDYDEFYMKITGRYAKYCLQLKDFAKAKEKVEELKAKYSGNDNCQLIINDIENELNQGASKKKVIKTEKRLFNAFTSYNKKDTDDYEWELSLRDVSDYLSNQAIDYGIINALNTYL